MNFKDLKIFQNKNFFDRRGYFKELIKEKDIKKRFPFIVMSKSKKMLFVDCISKLKILKVNIYQF